MSVLESATEAANRIIHGDTNPDDVQLVAGVLLRAVRERVPIGGAAARIRRGAVESSVSA
jgi:hypothetical protein